MKDIKLSKAFKRYLEIYNTEILVNDKLYKALVSKVEENVFDVEDNNYYLTVVQLNKDSKAEMEETVDFIDLEDELLEKINKFKEHDFKSIQKLIDDLVKLNIQYKEDLSNIKANVTKQK